MKKIFLLMAIALPLVLISCGDDKDEPKPDHHEYVDLGLPSGTLWATCNVGADSPEQYGDYFAWGETKPKDDYTRSTYKWYNGSMDMLMKYDSDSHYGKGELDPEDDAASMNWGSQWRMPTLEQLQELLKECDWQRTQKNGVNGRLATGPNGKSIFFPAAGGRSSQLFNDGKCGYYWSRTLCSTSKLVIEAAGQGEAYILFQGSQDNEVWYNSRYEGCTVRAVRASK